MEENTTRNNVRRVTPEKKPKPKTPPPTKPKPSRLSTNKVNSDPSSSPPKRTNTNMNGIRGANVHRLSSVFEDKNGPSPISKPLLAPSLPLSPKLPVPTVTINPKRPKAEKKSSLKNSSISTTMTTTTTMRTTKLSTETEVDESPLKFNDVKAKFEKAEASDVVTPNPSKKPTALSDRTTLKITTTNKNTNHVNKTRTSTNVRNGSSNKSTIVKKSTLLKSQSLDPIQAQSSTIDDESFGRDWIDVSEHSYLIPEIDIKPTKGARGTSQPPPAKSKKPPRLNRVNSDNDVQSSTKKQISTSPSDYVANRASIASFYESKQRSPCENSKDLPPTPPPKSPTTHTLSREVSEDSTVSVEEDEQTIDFKRRKKLWNVIKELVETERAFFKDMVLLEEVYSVPAQEIPIFNRFDCKTIFGNLSDIIDFSENFLYLLESAAGIEGPEDNDVDKHFEKENDDTHIGAAFSQMMRRQQGDESKMEAVYSEYCKRHEAAVQKLQEFDKDENVQGWLQKCKNQCEGRTRSWDIASLLIKPVQRVLKYPLLLQQIVSLTKPSHPDFEELKFAFSEIQNVAERINEIKRRKDIVEKIVGSKKKTDADLVHGITKSITRRGQMIKHATGISKATEDDLYNLYLEKFRNFELQGQQLAKDIREWVKVIKIYIEDQNRLAETFEEFYLAPKAEKHEEKYKKIMEYVKAVKEIAPTHGKEMEEALKKNIYPQIERFLELFKAPAAVMKKRERKILDYDRAMSIKAKGGTLDKHLQQSADAFTSISAQLHEELPSFFKLMTEYFDIIAQEFIKIQAKFYHQMEIDFSQYFYKFMEPQALKVSYDREVVLRDIDIVTEYTEYFHGQLDIEDELKGFVLLTRPPELAISGPTLNNNRRGRSSTKRSSWSDSSGSSRRADDSQSSPKEHRKGGWWDDSTERLSWHSNSSNTLRDSFESSPHKNSSHKTYAEDSGIGGLHDEDDDDTLAEEEKDKALFLCQTVYSNKSKQKNELNFEQGVLLKVIHIDESGEWWFAINEDNKKRGWVDPAFVSKLD